MNESIGAYRVIEIPPERRAMPNFFDMSWRKHSIYGMFEVDITVAKQIIEKHRVKTGESLSMTGAHRFEKHSRFSTSK